MPAQSLREAGAKQLDLIAGVWAVEHRRGSDQFWEQLELGLCASLQENKHLHFTRPLCHLLETTHIGFFLAHFLALWPYPEQVVQLGGRLVGHGKGV